MAKNPSIKVDYKVVNTAFNKGISEMKSEVSTLNKEFKLQKEEMKLTGSESEKLEASVEKLSKEYENAQQQTRLTESALENTIAIMGEGSKEAQTWSSKLLDARRNEEYLKNSIIETNTALDKSKQAMSEAAAETEKLEQNTKRLDTLFEATGSSIEDFTDILGTRLVTAIRNGEASSDQLELAINKIGRSSLGAKVDIGQLKNELDTIDDGSSINDVRSGLDRLELEATEAGDAVGELGEKLDAGNLMEGAEALSGISDAMGELVSSTTESSLSIDGLADRYNQAFGLIGTEADATSAKIVDLYKTGIFDSYEQATEALISTREQLQGLNAEDLSRVTEKAQQFADTFDSDMDESLRGVNALMQTYGMTADEAFDLMTVGAQNGLNKTDELGDNLAEYATLFEENGYSAEEMFAILEAGLDGGAYNLDRVNDLVKEFGIRLSDGTIATAVEDMGTGFQDVVTQYENGSIDAQEAFQLLGDEIMGLGTEQEQLTAISAIFGTMGEDAGMKVMESMWGVEDAVDGTAKAYEEAGGASEQLLEKSNMEQLKAGWIELQEALAPIGDYFVELAVSILPPVVSAIQNLVEWFQNLSPAMQTVVEFIGLFAGAAAFIIPVAIAIGGVVLAVQALQISLLPIIGIVAGIAAVVAGVILIFTNWGAITDWVGQKWSAFVPWASQIWATVSETVSHWFSNMWTNVTMWVTQIWTSVSTWFSNTATTIWTHVTNAYNSVLTWFTSMWTTISTSVQNIWNSVSTWFGNVATTIGTKVTEAATSVTTWFSDMWTTISTKVTEMYNSVVEWFGKIPGAIKEKWNEAQAFLSGINLWDIGSNIIQGLWDGMVSVWSGVANWISEKANSISNFFTSALDIFSPSRVMRDKVGKFIPLGIAEGIDRFWPSVEKVMQHGVDLVSGFNFNVPSIMTNTPQPVLPLNREVLGNINSQANNSVNDERVLNLLEELIDVDTRLLEKEVVSYIDGKLASSILKPHLDTLSSVAESRVNRRRGLRTDA